MVCSSRHPCWRERDATQVLGSTCKSPAGHGTQRGALPTDTQTATAILLTAASTGKAPARWFWRGDRGARSHEGASQRDHWPGARPHQPPPPSLAPPQESLSWMLRGGLASQ